MYSSRKEYLEILQSLQEKFENIAYHNPTSYNLWFIIRIHVGYFMHLLYNGQQTQYNTINHVSDLKIPKNNLKKKVKNTIRSYYLLLKINLLKIKLKNYLKNKTLLIGFQKHNDVNNKNYNQYLSPFLKTTKSAYILYLDDTKPTNIGNFLILLTEYYTIKKKITTSDINVFKNIIEIAETELDIHNSNLNNTLNNVINNYTIFVPAYKEFLKTINPRQLITYCYYNKNINAFIYSGNILNIETIEYQHSSISNTHFAYAPWNELHPKDSISLHFPKQFYVWEEADKELIINNFSSSNYTPKITITGNLHLKYEQKKYGANYKKSNTKKNILLCLQGTWIPPFLEEFIKDSQDYKWYIRLHPRYPNDKIEMEKLHAFCPKSINIAEANTLPLYELFTIVDTVITSFSGTALEAEQFSKNVLIFGEEGLISYKDKIALGKFHFINDKVSLLKYIEYAK